MEPLASQSVQLARFFGHCHRYGFKLNNLLRRDHNLTLSFEQTQSNQSPLPPQTKDLIDEAVKVELFANANIQQVDDQIHLQVDAPVFTSHLLSSFENQSYLNQFTQNLLTPDEKSNRILIEYSSPNIAKPFHYGHFKSTVLGNFNANLLEQLGHEVTRINYLGDCGTQFGLLSLGFSLFGDEEKLKDDAVSHLLDVYVKVNKEAERDANLRVEASARAKKLEEKSDESLVEEWKKFVHISTNELEKSYRRLGVTFDHVHRESMYIESARKLVKRLLSLNLIDVYEDGLKVCKVEGLPGEATSLTIEKSNGTSLYLTRDVCAAIDRKDTFNFDKALYVVDQGQSLHFKNIKRVLKSLNYDWCDDIQHVSFGRIAGMSTRKGQSVLFSDILNEAASLARENLARNKNTKVEAKEFDRVSEILGISALITHDFGRSRGTNYSFHWKSAMRQNGETGIALQYCHARLHSLERTCLDADDFSAFLTRLSSEPSLLTECLTRDESIRLLLHFTMYGQCLLTCRDNLCPKHLTHFLFALAHAVNSALRVLRVKNEPVKTVANGHLLLFVTARHILANGMHLMGLKPLDAM